MFTLSIFSKLTAMEIKFSTPLRIQPFLPNSPQKITVGCRCHKMHALEMRHAFHKASTRTPEHSQAYFLPLSFCVFFRNVCFFSRSGGCLCSSCCASQLHLAGQGREESADGPGWMRDVQPHPDLQSRLEPARSNSNLVSAGAHLMPSQYLSQCSVLDSECKWC